MTSLNPPLNKEDFINSGWKEVIDNSEIKACSCYNLEFLRKEQEAAKSGNIRKQAVFETLFFVANPGIKPESNDEWFAECFEKFSEENLNFLNEIVNEISDSELQARVADILCVKKINFPKVGQIAVEAYVESAKQLEYTEDWWYFTERIERALRLAFKIKYKIEMVFAYIEEVLERYQGEDSTSRSAELMEFLQDKENINNLQKEKLLDTIKYSKYANFAEKSATLAESNCDWLQARQYWEIQAEWHRIDKNSEKAYKAKIQSAETYIKEAEDSLTKHPTPYLKASHDLYQGFTAFEKLQSQGTENERAVIKNKLEQIHRLLLEYQQKSSHELKTVSYEINISNEVKLAQAKVEGKKFPDAMFALALLVTPPKVSDLEQKSKGFLPIEKTTQTGKVIARQPTNLAEAVRFEMYVIAAEHRRQYAYSFIEPARKQIILEHITGKSDDNKIKELDLMPLVTNNPFVPPRREKLFVKGLYAGLTGDFITATHILIPQIENSVRYILSNRGAITSGIDNKNNGIQKEDNLNSTLYPSKYPQITSIFDEDTLFDLQGLLIEHSGSNLRNRMAHGLISDDDFSSSTFSYLWWLTLRLCFGIGILVPQEIVEESNPWIKFAGMFKDDPLFDEFVEEMAKNRRELDEEIAAYEASLEENNAA